MEKYIDKLQVVVLNSFYDSVFSNNLSKQFYPDILELKLRGYLKQYPYGAMPIDEYDHIANHITVYYKEKNQLIPVMGNKTIDLSKCRIHNKLFPLQQIFKSTKDTSKHQIAVNNLVTYCEDHNKTLSYESSFTINTENKELTSFLIKDILVSLLVNYHNDNNTDNLYSLSVTRHRIDKLFESWGYRLVTWQNESLLPFNLDFLFNEEVKLYQHDCNWSQESLCKADKYQDLWANRISIAPLLENEKAA